MIFLTVPKPFIGHIADIQYNAIRSWQKLKCLSEIIVLGDPEDIKINVDDFEKSITIYSDIVNQSSSVPILSDIMRVAKMFSQNESCCFINTDIVLLEDFDNCYFDLSQQLINEKYLLTAQRKDVKIKGRMDFNCSWQNEICDLVAQQERKYKNNVPLGADYFVFRGLYDFVPNMLIGRGYWDNWLIYDALREQAMVVDCSIAVTAIHQIHDYRHIEGSGREYCGVEVYYNRDVAKQAVMYNVFDANYIFREKQIIFNQSIVYDEFKAIDEYMINAKNREIVIWGAGYKGLLNSLLLGVIGANATIVDNAQQVVDNRKVLARIPADILPKNSKNTFVIIASDAINEIITLLSEWEYSEDDWQVSYRFSTAIAEKYLGVL